MWKRTEVKKDGRYFLQLCQRQDARRYVRLVEVGAVAQHPDRVFDTEEIQYGSGVTLDQVLCGDVEAICEHVHILGGGRIFFDAHGIWLTEEELHQLENDDFVAVWSTKVPPVFPPK